LVKEYAQRKGGVIPNDRVLAAQMKISAPRLRDILEKTEPVVQLDCPLPNTPSTDWIIDDHQDPETQLELSFLRQSLESAMATELSPHERDILRLR